METTEIITAPTSSIKAITPDWVKDAVFYEIFPDRFAKSERVLKPHNLELWDTPPTAYGFKGGDLLGVVEHLDYLIDLGINAIYFTPIFASTANHRYHTYDYFQVDPILGGNAAFKILLDEAHRRGMRVILDGVFNHASRGLYQFNHTLENGTASPYYDWFNFKRFPLHAYDDYGAPGYDAWWNLKALPKFNHANPQVREFIMRVAEHWIEQGIDGWRLDVPGEVDDDEFWREFRRRVKKLNPEAYIVGEMWQQATRWLVGDQFDAVMNYQFTRACLSFFVGVDEQVRSLTHGHSYGELANFDARAFAKRLEEVLEWYPTEISYAQLNLLDSHDTARYLSIAKRDTTALKLALLTMMTYPGAPMLYYGDEIAMLGGKDPDCRRSMVWDESRWDHNLRETIKCYIALRKKYRALRRRGEYAHLYSVGHVYAFARKLEGETVIVALNAGKTPATIDLDVSVLLPDSTTVREEWGEGRLSVTKGKLTGIRVPARDGVVWTAEK